MEERRLVDLLLQGKLEAVTQGLVDGLYSWEELDQPHNAQGSTPLISACQMGLHMVRDLYLNQLPEHYRGQALMLSEEAWSLVGILVHQGFVQATSVPPFQ